MQALQDFCRRAAEGEDSEPLAFLCGFASRASGDSFEMQVAEGRPLTQDAVSGLLGTLLGIYARDNRLAEEEIKGMMLEAVSLKDSVLPAQESDT